MQFLISCVVICGVSNFRKQAVSVVYRNLRYLNQWCGMESIIKSNFVLVKSFIQNLVFFSHLYDRSNESNEIKMSTKDEQDEDYSIKTKRKKKALTTENCL